MTPSNRRATELPSMESLNARRYIEFRDSHWFWKDHKEELDEMLDKHYAETQRREADRG